jgi:hypothetical protein
MPESWIWRCAASFPRSCRCCSQQEDFISRAVWEMWTKRRSIPTAVRKCAYVRRRFSACEPRAIMVAPVRARLAGLPAKRSPALPADVKLRAERKPGGRAEALPPQQLRSVFISFGGPLRTMEHSVEDAVGMSTGDKIAGATG